MKPPELETEEAGLTHIHDTLRLPRIYLAFYCMKQRSVAVFKITTVWNSVRQTSG
jgi:hypothetical protein